MRISSAAVRSIVGRLGRSALFVVALSASQAAPSIAAPIALDINGGNNFFCSPQTNPGCTMGWAFQVNSPILVSDLGVFDANSDGLANSHDVGIWTAGGALLASVNVSNVSGVVAPSADATGQWVLTAVAPLLLAPGSYTIGAFYLNDDADRFRMEAPTITIPQITHLGGRAEFSVSSLTFPTVAPGGGAFEPSAFGPTFTATAVPEPGMLLLIGTGAVAAYRRTRGGGA